MVGTSTLGAEIAAARLMAPFFGASTIVWANTIAVVLVALSIGYWFGGRMADRRPDLRSLCLLVLVASVLLGLVPIVAQPFLSLSVEAFDDVSLGAGFGSLLGVLALVAIPVLMLGAVSPWAIRLKLERIEDSGETAGRMYAISTVGSLLGTFLSALLLIPLVGTQRTFLVFALALAVVATLGLGRRWALVPLGVAALLALPIGTVKAAGEGRVIHETDTEYQYARVIDHAGGERTLELNEGQAIHSLYRPETVLTDGYWDGFLVAPFAVRRDAAAARGDARLRGRDGRARLRPLLPGRAHRRRRDRRASCSTSAAATSACARGRSCTSTPRTRGRSCAASTPATTSSTSTPTASPTSRSTSRRASSSSSRASASRPAARSWSTSAIPEGSDELEKVLSATMGTALRHVARDPIEPTNTILMASQSPITRRQPARGDARPAGRAAPARPALGRADRAAAARRHRLHRRPGAGRVAGRQVDRRVRRGRRLSLSSSG